MSNTNPRQLAIERRENALREAARWSDFLIMYDELNGSANSTESRISDEQAQKSPSPSQVRKPVLATETAEATKELILLRGGPLLTREILTLLTQQGHEVGGKDPKATLFSRLIRAPQLVRFNKEDGWHVVSEPLSEPQEEEETPPLTEASPNS